MQSILTETEVDATDDAGVADDVDGDGFDNWHDADADAHAEASVEADAVSTSTRRTASAAPDRSQSPDDLPVVPLLRSSL